MQTIHHMNNSHNKIIMLGTGSAGVTRCYNTCFFLKTADTSLLVDAGGGNGIMSQIEKASISLTDIHHMFITHAHTDHILGAVWVVRMIMHRILGGEYKGNLNIYGNDKVISTLKQICLMTLHKNYNALFGSRIMLCEKLSGDEFQAGDISMQCFDVLSDKEKLFGFRAIMPGGATLVCMGDEPCNRANYPIARGADWLMCEAFCLYKDRDVFKPYEKFHSTARDAGAVAAELGVKNLLLYHTEDKTLATRRTEYTREAAQSFKGNIFVPDDLETIYID